MEIVVGLVVLAAIFAVIVKFARVSERREREVLSTLRDIVDERRAGAPRGDRTP